MSTRTQPAQLDQLAESVVAATGMELVKLELQGAGNARLLRLYIDQPTGVETGIGLEDCERVSRALSAALDQAEDAGTGVIPGAYTLEVSSPGLDRPLVKPADFDRFAGQRAQARTRTPIAGSRRFVGTLLGGGEQGCRLRSEAGAEVEIAWDNLEQARLAPLWETGSKRLSAAPTGGSRAPRPARAEAGRPVVGQAGARAHRSFK